MRQKNNYTVPEGYFGNLKERLSGIPGASSAQPAPAWSGVRPYLALAASFVLLVAGGTAILRNTVRPASGLSADELLGYFELIPATDPYLLFNGSDDLTEAYSDEDIINYLIETGVSLEQLAYAQEN